MSDDKRKNVRPVDAAEVGISLGASTWRRNPVAEALGPKGMPVKNSNEITRILNLPRRDPVEAGTATAQAMVQIAMEKYSLGPRPNCRCKEIDKLVASGEKSCITHLKWEQAWILHEIHVNGGVLAHASVGIGKTMCDILAPLAFRDLRTALLLIPASLPTQLIKDYQLAAEHFRVPNIVIHLSGRRTWQPSKIHYGPDGEREPTLHVIPYTSVSGKKNSKLIENLAPQAIIADECDAMKDVNASRTMRLLRYFEEHEATTRFAGWTGTLLNASISECAHLAALALRERSPLPILGEAIDEFGKAIDPVPNPCPLGALTRFLNPGQRADTKTVRQAIRKRMAETAGIVMIGGKQEILTAAGEKVDLELRERVPGDIPDIVDIALEKIRDFARPDTLAGNSQDEIITDPLEQARIAREVATGMHYYWDFPNGEPKDLKDEWMFARKEFNSELRMKKLRGEPNLDSDGLCIDAARRYYGELPIMEGEEEMPVWASKHWPRWRDVKDKVKPETKANRLDSFLVDDAARWAVENNGIIWYGMKEFAVWLQERAKELYDVDIPIYGEGSGDRIVEEENGKRSIIASIKSHGRGRDRLQYLFNRQLVANCPAGATMWQQLLGRLLRRGQKNSNIITEIYLHTPELEKSFSSALRKSDFVKDMTNEDQTLLANWDGDIAEF